MRARDRASISFRRLAAEIRIVATGSVVALVLIVAVTLSGVVGYINAATSYEVRPSLESVQRQLDAAEAARLEGIVRIDGSPVDALIRSLSAVVERAELDLHYGTVVGAGEAVLALLSTALGAAIGITIGAAVVGGDFDRRTWFYELVNARSRRSVIVNKALAGVVLMVGVAAAGVTAAALAATAVHVVNGGVVLGGFRAAFLAQAVVFLMVSTLWVLLGSVGAFVTTRAGMGAAAGGLILLADAAISLNLAGWARWMITARVAGISRLWAPTSDVFVETGETTSIVWWGTFEQIGTYAVTDGVVAIAIFVSGLWLLNRVLLYWLPGNLT